MKVGTKSILYGAHAFWLHPFLVAWAWFKLHGFRRVEWVWTEDRGTEWVGLVASRGCYYRKLHCSLWDPRLWAAFFLHDLGYWGKPNMDGPEGERHPELGARIMRRLFGEGWAAFCLYHSRYYAEMDRASISPLCVADKLVIALTPAWLALPLMRATGEIEEYMSDSLHEGKYAENGYDLSSPEAWWESVREDLRCWVEDYNYAPAR